ERQRESAMATDQATGRRTDAEASPGGARQESAMTADQAAGGRADRMVIFGITGDLARVMTFRSLYRLEQRGLLTCPVVGVAVNDWTVDHLRQHAREAIEGTGEVIDPKVFDRFAARLSYVDGDFGD